MDAREHKELDRFISIGFGVLVGLILLIVIAFGLLYATKAHANHIPIPAITAGNEEESEVSVCTTEADAKAVLDAQMEGGYFAGLAVFNEKCFVYMAKWKAVREVGRYVTDTTWYIHEIEVREVYVEKLGEWAKNAAPERLYYIAANPLVVKSA